MRMCLSVGVVVVSLMVSLAVETAASKKGCKKASRKVPDVTTGSLRNSDHEDYGLHVAPDLQNLLNRKRSAMSGHDRDRDCNDKTENRDQVKYSNSKLKKDEIDDTVTKQKTKITKLQKSIHTNLLRLFHRLKKSKEKSMLPTRKSIFANHSVYEPLIAISGSAGKDKIVNHEAVTQESAKTLSDPAFESTESGIAGNNVANKTETLSTHMAGNSKVQPLLKTASGSPLDNTEDGATAHAENSTSDNALNTNASATTDTITAITNEHPGKTVLKPLSNLNKSTLKVLHRLVHKFFPNVTVQKVNGQPDSGQVDTKLTSDPTVHKLADRLAAMGSNSKPAAGSGGGKIHSKAVDDSSVFKDPYAEIAAGPDHPKAPPGIKLASGTRPMLNFGMPSDLTSPQGKEVKEKETKPGDGGGATHGGLVNPDVPETLPETDKLRGGAGGGPGAGFMPPDFPFPDGPGHARLNSGPSQTVGGLVNPDLADHNMLDNMRARAMQEQMQDRLRAQAMQGIGARDTQGMVGMPGIGGLQAGMEGMAGMPGMGVGFTAPGGFGGFGGYGGFGGGVGPAGFQREAFGDQEGFGRDSVFGGFPDDGYPERPGFYGEETEGRPEGGPEGGPFEPEGFNEYGYGPVGGVDVPAVGRNQVPVAVEEPQRLYGKSYDEDRGYGGYGGYEPNPEEEEVGEAELQDREPEGGMRAPYGLDGRRQVAYGREGRERYAYEDEFENQPEMDDGYDAEYDRKTKIAKAENSVKKSENGKDSVKLDKRLKANRLRMHKRS